MFADVLAGCGYIEQLGFMRSMILNFKSNCVRNPGSLKRSAYFYGLFIFLLRILYLFQN